MTVAGDGTGYGGDGGEATAGLRYSARGRGTAAGALYIADVNNNRVRAVSPPTVTTLARTVAGTGTAGYNGDGPATGVNVYYPEGMAVNAAGDVFIAD